MECVEAAALKTNSSLKEMSLKTTASQFDEFLSSNNVLNGAADDFFVDELFNFSNEDDNFVEVEEDFNRSNEAQEQQRQHSTLENSNESPNSGFVLEDEFGCLPTSELYVPAEELESLEWLSHFVEDSFASFPVPAKPEVRREEEVVTPFKTPVPAKARSKRTRTGGRVWSLSSPTFTESSSSSSSSSSSPTSPFVIELVEKPGGKRQRRKSAVKSGPVQPRRCSHCGVQKTPQWRTGPLGAKTLCNACGVRYKSGRLLPEYRPACSPTFSSGLHSNHHRKVLEMRKKKEVEVVVDAEVAPNVVPSFE